MNFPSVVILVRLRGVDYAADMVGVRLDLDHYFKPIFQCPQQQNNPKKIYGLRNAIKFHILWYSHKPERLWWNEASVLVVKGHCGMLPRDRIISNPNPISHLDIIPFLLGSFAETAVPP